MYPSLGNPITGSLVKQMPFGELTETFEAAGLSAKNLLALFKKVKEFGEE